MKHVTFGVAEPPYNVGDKRVVPDAVAADLQRRGLLSASVPFGAPEPKAPRRPSRAIVQPVRPTGAPDKRMAD